VVVVGGMGSLGGSLLAAFILGALEGATKLFFPEISSIVIFIAMALILLVFKNGLKGRRLKQ
jgi:branched-chain amino acid transport system permease protein